MEFKMFKTPMCGQCPTQREILDRVVSDIDGLSLEVIDVTEQTDLANKYGVSNAPTTVLVDDGEPVTSFRGLTQEPDLRSSV